MRYLIAILGIGLIVRLPFAEGLTSADEFFYAHAAYNLSNGELSYTIWDGTRAVGLYGPVALFYGLFGISDAITLSWPITTSLLSIVFIYGIGRIVHSEDAGLVAALVWVFLPQDIFISTQYYPDGPMAAFSTGAVYFALLGMKSESRWKYVAYFSSSICILWALLIKPQSILTLAFLILILVWKISCTWKLRDRFNMLSLPIRSMIGLVGFLLFLFAVLRYAARQQTWLPATINSTAFDLLQVFFTHQLYAFLTPLFLAAVLTAIYYRWRKLLLILAWLGFLFSYMEWGSSNLRPWLEYTPENHFTDTRNYLFLLAPIAVLTGSYLGKVMNLRIVKQTILILVPVSIITMAMFSILETRGYILLLSSLFGILFLLLSVGSPLLHTTLGDKVKNYYGASLLLTYGLAFLFPLVRHDSFSDFHRTQINNLRDAGQVLSDEPVLPIYLSTELGSTPQMTLNYYSGFQFGFDPINRTAGVISGAPLDISSIQSGYIVFSKEAHDLALIPIDWWQLAVIDQPPTGNIKNPPTIYLYKALDDELARSELMNAQQAANQVSSAENYRRLLGAAINSGDLPVAFNAFITLRQIDSNIDLFAYQVPVTALLEHSRQGNALTFGESLIDNGDFERDLSQKELDFQTSADLDVVNVEVSGGILYSLNGLSNYVESYWQILTLEPDTIYLFETTIQSTAEIRPLVWQAIGEDNINFYRARDEITNQETLQWFFITPHWDGNSQLVHVHPFVFLEKGEVWVEGYNLRKVLLRE